MIQNLTISQRRDIYTHIQELVDLASEINSSIYTGARPCDDGSERDMKAIRISEIRNYLEMIYKFRFVQFRPMSEYITDLSYPEQWMFALFVSEMTLQGELPE